MIHILQLLQHWKLACGFDSKQYWTERGHTYMRDYPPIGARGEELLLARLARVKFRSLIDIGCGYGRYLKCIADCFPSVKLTGVDISSTQIAEAQRYLVDYPDIQLKETDGLNLGFEDSAFDISSTYGCMIHIPKHLLFPFFEEVCRITHHKGLYREASHTRGVTLKRIIRPSVIWYSHDYEALFKYFQKPYLIVDEWVSRGVVERLYEVNF